VSEPLDLSPAVELFKLLAQVDARRRWEEGLPTIEEELAAEAAGRPS
jgi:hypothetical protein